MSEHLFPVWATPSERAERSARSRRAQTSMFDVVAELKSVFSCAACGAESEAGCTCARTGAVALELEPCGCICHRAPAVEMVDMFGRRSPLRRAACDECECAS